MVNTLSETLALIFMEYVAEESNSNPEQFKSDELFWFHSSVFALEFSLFWFRIIASKMLVFEIRLPLKEQLVATFHETRALTSRKSVVV